MKALLCIRQLPYSETTVNFAGMLAELSGSELTLMTVIEHEGERPSAEERLNQASTLLGDKKLRRKICVGEPAAEILRESRKEAYDIIVVGSHDVHGLLDLLLGTVHSKVADRAKSSVLVVKEGRTAINKMLIAIGGQKMKKRVVKAGARLAAVTGAAVTVFSVTSPVPSMYTGLEWIEETLEELLQTNTPIARHLRWSARYLAEREIPAEIKVKQGVAADEIMREAEQGGYDLLVIGARSLAGSLRRLLVAQVTPQVVERSVRSVLVVR